MQQTLDRMRAGNYTTRPQWEDVFTSMAKPKPEDEHKVKVMVSMKVCCFGTGFLNDSKHFVKSIPLPKINYLCLFHAVSWGILI